MSSPVHGGGGRGAAGGGGGDLTSARPPSSPGSRPGSTPPASGGRHQDVSCAGRPLPADKLILVMDAECALCSWGARTIAAHDSKDLFRIAPMQSAAGRGLLIAHGLDPKDPDSWLLVRGGEAMTGARAVIAAGRRLAFPWRAFAWAGACVPGPLREPAYQMVARNRIKWFGTGDLCALPDPELKRRLLDLP